MGARGKAGSSPRKHERHLTEGLSCVSGDVLDLSSGGMRVKSTERPPAKAGAVTSFTLRVGTKTLSVQGRMAWVKRASLLAGPYEYGVQFVGVSGAVAKVIDQLAMYGFVHDGKGEQKQAPKWSASGATETGAAGSAGAKGADGAPGATGPRAEQARPRVTVTADLPCFYETLGVTRDATQEQIRAAFRGLAKKLHPDVCKEPDAGERFAFITRVHEVLSDPELRERYDEAIAKRAAA